MEDPSIYAQSPYTTIRDEDLETVTNLLDTDVLFGRDKIMFNHIGNVRFRLVVQSRAKEYEHAPSRRVKSTIVYSVVQTVQAYGGRFLRKDKLGNWKSVSVTEAIQKVGHALRDKKQHDVKMKAKLLANPGAPILSAKNKSVEGGCDLLMKLGQVCAKEFGVPAPKTVTAQSLSKEEKQPTMNVEGRSLPVVSRKKERRLPSAVYQQPILKRVKTKHNKGSSSKIESDDDAAKAILALTRKGIPKSQPEAVMSLQERSLGDKSNKNTSAENPEMPPPPPPQRLDPTFSLQQQHAQQMNQQRMMSHHHQQQTAFRHPTPFMQHRSPSQVQALLHAQHLNNLIQQVAAGAQISQQMSSSSMSQQTAQHLSQLGSSNGAGQQSPKAPSQGTRQDQSKPQAAPEKETNRILNESDIEASRSVTPPSPAATASHSFLSDGGDDDGHWIFYPIKVPTLKLAAIKGWKLALIPADGNGTPIELDHSGIQFPPNVVFPPGASLHSA